MNKLIILLISFSASLFTPLALAADDPIGGKTGGNAVINLGSKQSFGIPAFNNPNANPGSIVSNVIQIMFILGGLAVLIYFVWGAFDWITSGGDKEKIAGARRKIVNALIGLGLLALSAFIVSLFGQIVGFDPFNTPNLPRLDSSPPPK